MKKPYILTISSLLVILILLLGVSGCADRPTPTPEVPTSSPTPEFTPTATPAPSRIVLFDPAAQASSAAVTVINDFAAANSLVFETWTELASDLNGLKIMVVFSGLDNLAEVAAGQYQHTGGKPGASCFHGWLPGCHDFKRMACRCPDF
jgi:hypothetical protein